jgi:hypothetical protein
MSQYARRISVAAATALLLLLLSGVAAHAAKPEREVVPFEGTGEPFFPCSEFGYDFDILVDFFGSNTMTTWRDAEGNVTRIKIHGYGTGTIYPDNDPTNRETGSSPTNITVDFLKETYTISGQELHNNIPGEGRVAQQVGTITWAIEVLDRQAGEYEVVGDPLHVGGPHPGFENIPWCEIFV